jgi:hypothetical protein
MQGGYGQPQPLVSIIDASHLSQATAEANYSLTKASMPQDLGMQAAIYQGLYGISATEPCHLPRHMPLERRIHLTRIQGRVQECHTGNIALVQLHHGTQWCGGAMQHDNACGPGHCDSLRRNTFGDQLLRERELPDNVECSCELPRNRQVRSLPIDPGWQRGRFRYPK